MTDTINAKSPTGEKSPAESRSSLTLFMGVEHANNLGNVHGGVLMKLVDEAGAMAAIKHARKPCVTVAIDRMTFDHPVRLGELVTFTARVTRVGRTSIDTRVVVTAENPITGETTHTNTAYLLYVALGSDGNPTPVPRLTCETEEDKRLCTQAKDRQKLRLLARQQEEENATSNDV